MKQHSVRNPGTAVSIEAISKRYNDNLALSYVDLDIRAGEFITLLGASGSGKSTLLNIIAGFLPPTSGTIRINGGDVTGVSPHRRGLGMVFQNYALFPHMSIFDNVAFSLRRRKYKKVEVQKAVMEALELVELSHLANRRPAQLSGGQQQRIALARAIVFRPPVLLLDEPLGALDKRLRDQLQRELKLIHSELGITFVLVTHDQEEALSMSDRVALMRNGEFAQIGTPQELYTAPRELYVAEFLGESNIIHGQLKNGVFMAGSEKWGVSPSYNEKSFAKASLLIRPEDVSILPSSAENTSGTSKVDATLVDVTYLGSTARVGLQLRNGERFAARIPADPNVLVGLEVGGNVVCTWDAGRALVYADGSLL